MRLQIAAAMVLLSIPCAGCLVTDPIEARETPPIINHPTQINEETASPNNQQVIELRDGITCQQKFTIGSVIDEDVQDALVVSWFVDGYLEFYQSIHVNGVAERGGVEWIFDTSKIELGLHVIKVTIIDNLSTASHAWFINTTSASYCLSKDN